MTPYAPAEAIKPFLKWAGGKTQLLKQLRERYPDELSSGQIAKHIEPFLGGGAVFLDVAQRYAIKSAYLSDVNPELVLVYRVVQRSPDRLIELLEDHRRRYMPLSNDAREAYYYEVRENYNQQLSLIDFVRYTPEWELRAANMIFLNKTCYNGLFRVNAQGKFNVPFGRYKRPSLYDERQIMAISQILQIAEVTYGGFMECEPVVDDNSFVYFDPPYRPLSPTAHFTSYSQTRFDDVEQIRLAQFYRRLDHSTDAKLMLSNSDPKNTRAGDDFFDELYRGFTIYRVVANRMINSNTARRGKITELLITNY